MAPAAGHKCSVHHTRSAEHKCSAYTPFVLHVLLHFIPSGIASSRCAAVSNTTNSSAGRQDNCFTADTVSHPQEVLRQAAGQTVQQEKQNAGHTKPFQKFTKRPVTSDNVQQLQKK
jgi:hypothetical protein